MPTPAYDYTIRDLLPATAGTLPIDTLATVCHNFTMSTYEHCLDSKSAERWARALQAEDKSAESKEDYLVWVAASEQIRREKHIIQTKARGVGASHVKVLDPEQKVILRFRVKDKE